MRIIDMPRGTGKTFQLVKISETKNIPIIVKNNLTKKIYSKEYPNAHFMSWQEYSHLSCYDKPINILIDELPSVLEEIFKDSIILAATYSSEDQYDDNSFLTQMYYPEKPYNNLSCPFKKVSCINYSNGNCDADKTTKKICEITKEKKVNGTI